MSCSESCALVGFVSGGEVLGSTTSMLVINELLFEKQMVTAASGGNADGLKQKG
jgi:hypothetical protein